MGRYDFTYYHEIGHQGQSLVPHYPGGKSGVTIGPGYDMSMRSPEQIIADLTRVGVDEDIAVALSQASSKSGPEAQQWISRQGGLYITDEQQKALFEEVLVPEYEERMVSQINGVLQNSAHGTNEPIDITQLSVHQREILFDFTYNAGLSRFPTLVDAVLNEDWEMAAAHYERFSNDEPLTYRNEMFYSTFLSSDGIEQYINLAVEQEPELFEIDALLDGMMSEGLEDESDIARHDRDKDLDIDQLLDESEW
ncbi:MAG: pesticin C-terminus-like muramidase [Dyadobacter sp.]|uniref:pesticin C-terminus-like muramidase n=1 Tax=Dyadobacter sp. TaxID=1914288 RepID=UPI0032672068